MAHDIEQVEDGSYSFFSNRLPAWHNLGKIVNGALDWITAIKMANMDFEVVKRQLQDPQSGDLVDTFGIFRTDNNAFLGNVGDRYTPIQNEFQFKFMDSILGAGNAHYETAGVLGKGERVFMLANLSEEYDLHGTGDKHKAYLAGVGSHDGSSAQRFFTTEVRIVCANTLQVALGKAGKAGVAVKHTVNAEQRILSKVNVLEAGRDAFKTTMEKLEILAEKQVNSEVVATSLAQLFDLDMAKDLPTKTMNTLETIKNLFESNDKDAFPEFRGTAYNLLNAITEYTDHYKNVRETAGRVGQTTEQMRSDSAMFGTGAEFKSKALDLLIKQTESIPATSLHSVYSLPVPSNQAIH